MISTFASISAYKNQRAMVVAYAYKPSTQKLRKKDCPHKLMDYLTI